MAQCGAGSGAAIQRSASAIFLATAQSMSAGLGLDRAPSGRRMRRAAACLLRPP